MRHPFRRFSYIMAEELKMTLPEVQAKVSSYEMSEWMAYKLTKDNEWVDKFNKQEELAKSKQMSEIEKVKAFKRLLGGK